MLGATTLAALAIAPAALPDRKTLATWGVETLDAIRRDFRPDPDGYYRDKIKEEMPAFNWGVGILLSAMAEAAPLSPEWKTEAIRYATKTRSYWNPLGPVPGYDVLPTPKPIDRYYDDNAWMVMSLSDLSHATGRPEFRTHAAEAMVYVLSGASPDGSIYWRESDKASRNTCSNAPVAAALLALYEKDRDPARLARAESLYDWTYRTLRDPADDLMWDAISNDGKIEKTKWSYNTALMARSAAELFRLTKKARYRKEAIAFARAGRAKWVREDGAMTDESQFAHLLLESFWFVKRATKWGDAWSDAPKILAALRSRKSADGRYPGRWDGTEANEALITQASAARAYLFAASRL